MKHPPFGFEKPEHSPGFLLWQTTISWERRVKEALIPHGISHAQFVILAILIWFKNTDQQATQTSISTLSKLDKMTISKSLKKLALEGYVIRSEIEEDTRAKSALLTKKGESLICMLVPIVEQIDKDFFSALHGRELVELLSVFEKLRRL